MAILVIEQVFTSCSNLKRDAAKVMTTVEDFL